MGLRSRWRRWIAQRRDLNDGRKDPAVFLAIKRVGSAGAVGTRRGDQSLPGDRDHINVGCRTYHAAARRNRGANGARTIERRAAGKKVLPLADIRIDSRQSTAVGAS